MKEGLILALVLCLATVSIAVADTEPGEVTVELGTPQVETENIYSENDLLDLKSDNDQIYSQLSTDIHIYVSHPEGREYLENARILIRDAQDTLVENTDVWASRTAVDEDTYEFTLTNFDPASDNLGDWDVGAWARDNLGQEDQGWRENVFVVDEATVTINLNPNSDLGFAKSFEYEADGSVWLDHLYPENVEGTLIDEYSGSRSFSGTDYAENIEITGDPGDNVRVVSQVQINDAIDGQVETNYTVNDNQEYTVYLRWEDNYELVPEPIENENIHLTAHFENYTVERDLENNPEDILLHGDTTPRKMTINHNGDYIRSRLSFDLGKVTFILNDDPEDLGEYQLSLEDYTNDYVFPNGQIWLWRYYENNVMRVDERWWDGSGNAYPTLEIGRDYRYAVHNAETGETTWFPSTTFPSTLSKTIQVVEFTEYAVDNTMAGVRWDAFREDENVYIKFDSDGAIDNTEYKILDSENNVVENGTMTANSWIVTYSGNENEKYEAELTFNYDGEVQTVYRSIGMPLKEKEGPGGLPFGGFGIPLAAIGGIVIVFFVAMAFRERQAGNAMLAIAITVAFLDLSTVWLGIPIMPVAHIVVVAFFAFAVMYKLAEGMG